MKKLLLVLSVFVLFASFQISTTSAQATTTASKSFLVATVNIYNATNTRLADDTYSISFQLKNRVGIQSDIRYGLKLVDAKTNQTVDLDLANQALTLGEGEAKDITLKYSIPSFVPNGEYQLQIVSETSNGILLAVSPIGFPVKTITIANHQNNLSIQDCRFINVDNVNKLSPNQNLNITCNLESSQNVNGLKIQMITHEGNVFGNIVDSHISSEKISLKANVPSEQTFSITTQNDPSSYALDIFLVNGSKSKVSSATSLNYTVAGQELVIKNAILDKTTYEKGDTAHLQLFAAPTSLSKSTYQVSVEITSKNGDICGETTSPLTIDNAFSQTDLEIPIKQACNGAIARTTISNDKGQLVASNELNSNTKEMGAKINANVKDANGSILNIDKFYVVLFIIILVLLAYGILVFKKDDRNKNIRDQKIK